MAAKEGKKARKYRRNIDKCAAYKRADREQINKARKIANEIIRSEGNNQQAINRFKAYDYFNPREVQRLREKGLI